MLRYFRTMGVLLGVALLAACGGNGELSGGIGSSSQGVARGAITGFGSIFLNGTEFDTTGATFTRNGATVQENALSVGMVVKMRGDIDNHKVSRVEFVDDVRGPVDQVLANGLRVMGQVALFNASTHIDPSLNFATVAPGDIVEISGTRDANDEIVATFAAKSNPANVNAFTVLGQVSDLDTTAKTFRIGGVSVDYSSATFTDFTVDDLADGQLVQVSDADKAYSAGALDLVATNVDLDGFLRMEDEDDFGHVQAQSKPAQIEGLITDVVDATHFVVSGVNAIVTGTTTFSSGSATNLVVGAAVEVQGTLAADGTVTATQIAFEDNAVHVAGVAEAVDSEGQALSIFGVTISSSATVRFTDERDHLASFSLDDIAVGDFIDVRGTQQGNVVIAREIVRTAASDTLLRGVARDIDGSAHTLTLLGTPIVTDTSTQFRSSPGGQSMSADDFFAALREGQTLVEARWTGAPPDSTVAVARLSTGSD